MHSSESVLKFRRKTRQKHHLCFLLSWYWRYSSRKDSLIFNNKKKKTESHKHTSSSHWNKIRPVSLHLHSFVELWGLERSVLIRGFWMNSVFSAQSVSSKSWCISSATRRRKELNFGFVTVCSCDEMIKKNHNRYNRARAAVPSTEHVLLVLRSPVRVYVITEWRGISS